MKLDVVKKLFVEKDTNQGDEMDDNFELGPYDSADIWTKDGSCHAAEIYEILDDKIVIADEDGNITNILLTEIEDIQEA
ncbi:hypothetical protein SAMN05660649_04289 [Desulfotomaculum arcticum]|uniref:Uncharacterized protein n=1 Tax=Desulfotruncus arcticus DSM 17038 TaxID=1121424 RepID=A0A1I2Y8J1_9FIRM|nr:hypothetical protein [Desulfotruncus arcticus]SFH21687.1 hypothetical protein SAMN05660649_04289 [Desulfotomaculum arcticum] [Desulfotruncus arcticus DSM 17038]